MEVGTAWGGVDEVGIGVSMAGWENVRRCVEGGVDWSGVDEGPGTPGSSNGAKGRGVGAVWSIRGGITGGGDERWPEG